MPSSQAMQACEEKDEVAYKEMVPQQTVRTTPAMSPVCANALGSAAQSSHQRRASSDMGVKTSMPWEGGMYHASHT